MMQYLKVSLIKIVTITVIIIAVVRQSGFAQQDPQFSQYIFNQLYINPAYAGVNQDWNEVLVLHRSQWVGYEPTFDDGVSPSTQVVSLNMPFTQQNIGVGLHLANDRVGLFNNFELQLSLAYHVKLSKGLLSFGLRSGLFNQSLDTDRLRFRDANDPLAQSLQNQGSISQFTPDMAIGIYYNTSKYFVGTTINHILAGDFDYGTNFSVYSQQQHFNFIGGIHIEPNRDLTLTPSILLNTDFNTLSFETSILGTYKDKYHLGTSLRELNAAIIIIGLSPLSNDRMRIAYSFDVVLSKQARNAKEASSHEITLSYRLPALLALGPKPVRTPRYRFN